MDRFTVRGRFKGRNSWKGFTTTIDAQNPSVAEEHILSQLGSRHGLKRTQIEIDEITAV